VAKANVKYNSSKKKPGKTKAFFICLLIAAFLWTIHALNTVYTYNLRIPVSFKNLPQNKKPLVHMPEFLHVDVKASGLRLALILLNRPFKPLDIDFNTLKSVNRNQNYVLSSSQLDFKSVLKFSTKIRNISPDTLYFSEKVGYQKNVPIKIPLYVKCEAGFGFTEPEITPSYITIWGDTSLIDKVDTIYTQPFSLTNLNKSINARLEVLKPDEEVYTAVSEVNMFIEVSKLVEQQITIPIYDVQNNSNQQVNIFPSTVRVTYTSIQTNYNAQDTLLFRATIDSEKMNKVTRKCPVTLSTLPGNVTIMNIEPREVEIVILKKL